MVPVWYHCGMNVTQFESEVNTLRLITYFHCSYVRSMYVRTCEQYLYQKHFLRKFNNEVWCGITTVIHMYKLWLSTYPRLCWNYHYYFHYWITGTITFTIEWQALLLQNHRLYRTICRLTSYPSTQIPIYITSILCMYVYRDWMLNIALPFIYPIEI